MRINPWVICCLIIPALLVLGSCEALLPPAPDDKEVLDGPVDGLSGTQLLMFTRGDAAFTDQIFTVASGLGPYFVATSCGGCHAGDGKGHPFTTLVRFGQVDATGNHYLDLGGPQLQNRALPGFHPEQIPAGATFARFTPPSTTGLGFLQAVPDSIILALADPNDANGDGISGVPNWVTLPSFVTPRPHAISQGGQYAGRFGKKGAVYNLFLQTVNAYNQDIGVTSVFLPDNPVNPLDGNQPVPSTTPEVSDESINAVVFYLMTLKAPPRRQPDNPLVLQGEYIFNQIGCANCHTPTLRTGFSSVDALTYKEVHPYSDLLLHDMGAGLDDGYTEGSAKTFEWRTPPLWGLGLSPRSQGGEFFLMHDGRAPSIEEAIQLHGGEGTGSRTLFQSLAEGDRHALITFLKSL